MAKKELAEKQGEYGMDAEKAKEEMKRKEEEKKKLQVGVLPEVVGRGHEFSTIQTCSDVDVFVSSRRSTSASSRRPRS